MQKDRYNKGRHNVEKLVLEQDYHLQQDILTRNIQSDRSHWQYGGSYDSYVDQQLQNGKKEVSSDYHIHQNVSRNLS